MRMAGTGTVAVMGAGAWGTALAKVLADAGGEVILWARRADVAEQINSTRYNPDYLPGTLLPPGIRATPRPRRRCAAQPRSCWAFRRRRCAPI
ncbi:NAD-dependent glycerol-3-phosphate dehydrogenase family protein [Mycobacterium kansasii 732]|nr:NAD-dependent glycerol-3-phosphate dehydrogenase family protein [Mycobacterium kansasii 732]